MKKTTPKKGMSTGAKIGIGAGLVAAGVAAYLLLGPDGKKNRKTVSKWGDMMKGEIAKKVKSAKSLTESAYHDVIDEIHTKYQKIKGVDKKELAMLAAELRKHWKVISKGAKAKPKAKPKAKK